MEQNKEGTKRKSTSTTDTTGSNTDMEEGTSDLPVPDEEDLLDDILDLEEEGTPHVDENNSDETEAINTSSASPQVSEEKEELEEPKSDIMQIASTSKNIMNESKLLSDDTVLTEEANNVYRNLIEIFPNTPADYLRCQAKNISGNPGALELFIDRHLQNDSQPSNDWKQEDQRISEELEFQSQQSKLSMDLSKENVSKPVPTINTFNPLKRKSWNSSPEVDAKKLEKISINQDRASVPSIPSIPSVPSIPSDPSISSFPSVSSVFWNLIEIFPNTPADYLRFEAKNISGNPGALELFINRHLQNDSQPPKDWKCENQRISEGQEIDHFYFPQVTFRSVKSYLNPTREATSLTSDEKEFQMVERHFLKMSQSLLHVIMSIDFVNNPTLQMKFDAKKLNFQKSNIPDEEVFAYHGTKPENIPSICQNNLNIIKRAVHGNGYYFSESPDVSLQYGGQKQGLILFKTLPGLVYTGVDKNQHSGSDAK